MNVRADHTSQRAGLARGEPEQHPGPRDPRRAAWLVDHFARLSLRARRFASHAVQTSAGRVHVLSADGGGPLPTLVLLHGLSSAGVHYIPLIPHLRPHVRRLVLPDIPAHGFSDVPADGGTGRSIALGLVEALDQVLDEPAIFYGNSLGALAAIRYALARPERVRGLFLASPGGAPMDAHEISRFVASFSVDTHASALAFVDRVFARPSVLRHVFAWGVRRRLGHPSVQRLLAATTPSELLTREELHTLRAPVMLSWGRRDGVLPRAHLDFFREALPPHAVVVEPEHHGHTPYLEDAAGVGGAIVDFCRGVDVPRLPPRRH